MDIWKAESSAAKQTAVAIVCITTGLILAVGFRTAGGGSSVNSTAGMWLGILLLAIGVPAFIMRGRQTIVVDPAIRRITVEDSTVFGGMKRTIPFSEITDIGIGYLGKRSNWVTIYYLILKLRDGEEYPLFAPGRFYEGSSTRSIVEGWQLRLQDYLRGHGR